MADQDSDIGNYLGNVQFPADKPEMINAAKQAHAPAKIIHILGKLPDREYKSLDDAKGAQNQDPFPPDQPYGLDSCDD